MTSTGYTTPKVDPAEIRHLAEPNPAVVIPPDYGDHQRAHYLARRLRVALLDFGLDRFLPVDWITPTADGLVLGNLTFKQADALVIGLEDLTTARLSVTPAAGPDRPPFFGRAIQ